MKISQLVPYIIQAGDFGTEMQGRVVRNLKSDGSVVTDVDIEINRRICRIVKEKYPDCNFIAEEESEPLSDFKNYTFVLDPLDGTDAYSMGMPCWCVALGLLKDGVPEAGIVYAPTWGLKGGTLFVADTDGRVFLNGVPFVYTEKKYNVLQIMAPSSIHKFYEYGDFPGKIRNTGSSVISMLAVLLHSQISGAVINRSYIWDIAASHAIISRCGIGLEYFSGGKIDYSQLIYRKKIEDYLICGNPQTVEVIRKYFKGKTNGEY